MPSGEGVEAIFAPLANGEAYLKRLAPIYDMLDPEDFKGDSVPGYFNGKSTSVSEDELRGYGEQLITGMKQLMEEHADVEGTAEAASYLAGVHQIVILPREEIGQYREKYDPILLHEILFEIVSEHKNLDEPVQILSEAYYSIACDYWISYYLQWHRFDLPGDPLAPYFELYRLGYNLVFSGSNLYIWKL
ncbi:hypothetical protein NLX71_23795 [Paenibacillus sp. MZ04-78.2]|uniref:hypothetical protein n=1 Tax=Paenibacillus sp. MZ04-78.2 TaxID=2962034 RepID=UPI0020B780BD|nr:hypothetical protein [Paenibacillus sp. MZ04-78.2]MCP3776284.1 hypothetical protein [Paenibacillus sp. MZ04-78.2]